MGNKINNLDKYGVDVDKVIKKTKKILKKALLELKKEALNGEVKDKYYGICANLGTKVQKHKYILPYTFVSENCKDWIMFSGDEDYPVPFSDKLSYGKLNCWDTPEKLYYRLSLIDHLLTKVS